MQLSSIFFMFLRELENVILVIFKVIFPEHPEFGLGVFAIMAALMLFYGLKSGIKYGFKIAMMIGGLLSFLLFSLHHMMKLVAL